MWKTYGKTYATLLATLVMAGIVTFRQVAEGGVTPSEWIMVLIALFGTFTVWGAANISGFTKAKTLLGAVALVLNLLVSLIIGGLTSDELLLLVVQFLGALGVAGAPAPVRIVTGTVVSR
jgi:FtsH-binding integral membrane protein